VLRRSHLFLALLAWALCTSAALAAPLDKAANAKIDEAINQHYLGTNFNKAESVLLGTLKACGNKCSPSITARAWMYVGIVRGSGKNDLVGARQAFDYAVYVDRNVKLDAALATPETKGVFRQAKAGGGSPPPAMATEAAPEPAPAPVPTPGPTAPTPRPGPAAAPEPTAPRAIECTPATREVQTRRAVPMQCTTGADAAKGEIRYKEYGGEQWQIARMVKKGAAFQGTIPCEATMLAGRVLVTVVLQDAAGSVVDTLGSINNPMVFTVVAKTAEPPPAFPDQSPPARCAEPTECPPDFPGCHEGRGDKVWGDSCENTQECRQGLACANGTCANATGCSADSECAEGEVCVGGTCESKSGGGAGAYKQNWFGLHVAMDFSPVGGTDVCSRKAQTDQGYACFLGNNGLPGQSTSGVNGQMGKVQSGVALATTRLLVSYDRAFTEHLTAGARLGFAMGGGPTTLDGTAFLPFHGEVRGDYYFLRLRERFRPYAGVAFGVAQVDTKIKNVQILVAPGVPGYPNIVVVDVWRKSGQGFGALSAGAAFAVTDAIALQVNLNAMMLFPAFGIALEPSLGLTMGL